MKKRMMPKKKKPTLADWEKGLVWPPRPLTPTEEAIWKRGHDRGFDNGRISGLAEGEKKAIRELEASGRKFEARLKLINAAGQAYEAITRAMFDDGCSLAGSILERSK